MNFIITLKQNGNVLKQDLLTEHNTLNLISKLAEHHGRDGFLMATSIINDIKRGWNIKELSFANNPCTFIIQAQPQPYEYDKDELSESFDEFINVEN